VCGQALPVDRICGNPVCHFDDRYFTRVWAISMRTGQMRAAITRYEYDGKWGWAAIFGRILVGFLGQNPGMFGPYHLITPARPTPVQSPSAASITRGGSWKPRRSRSRSPGHLPTT
jgi:predicted amidophosphoribosyltransferase